LVFLAEAHGEVGQTEEGLNVLAEALAMTDKSGERYYEAEIYRLKGELTLKQSRVQSLESRVEKEAEECFQKAIDIARPTGEVIGAAGGNELGPSVAESGQE
jgi:hypothetical protein